MEDGKDKAKFQNLWVGDSGATCHMICNHENLRKWKSVNEEVIVDRGGTLPMIKIRSLKLKFRDSKGEDSLVNFPKVKFVPKLKINLFRITLGIQEGWKVESFDKLLTVKKERK
jgi:hypothetical protein